VISEANKFIEDTKPWNLLKENKTEELNSFIMLLVSVIRNVSRALTNFMPQSAKSISEQFASNIIKKGVPLFPRIEVK
ncbi:MAG TPA: hypothetical protein DEQ77_02300, partial [Candidatus Omnitrophica bacterium]|nr:hypothetical protein [Candidatus Omnitrophota bacterium]